jgi:Flp pilus assembly protein TadD
MSTESENPNLDPSRPDPREKISRRRGRWWSRLRFPRFLSQTGFWFYDRWLALWFPPADGSHGYHGYAGAPRQNRVKWLWRRLRRWGRQSSVASAVNALKGRWFDWWHPGPNGGQTDSYYGRIRRHRLVRDWRRLLRFARRSFVGRGFTALANRLDEWWYPPSPGADSSSVHDYDYGSRRRNRLQLAWNWTRQRIRSSRPGRKCQRWADKISVSWYDWWYPPSQETSSRSGHGYGYAYRRRNRLQLAWIRVRRRFYASWFGRKCQVWADQLFEWYFPLEEGPGGHGYGYGSYRRVSRPVLLTRRGLRWYRNTWLGQKTGWVLDEAEDLMTQVAASAAEDFAWRSIQRRLKRWQTWAVLICLAATLALAYKYGLPRYRQAVERNYALQAQRFVVHGDIPRAMLRARQVLAMNPDNAAACGVLADVADYSGSPYALQWRQRLVFLNPDATNRLALARTALRAEGFPFPTATKALNEIAPTNRQSPAYHLVAGALAIKLNNLPAAEQHYEAALKLDPNDPVNRMSVAVVRLQSGDPKLIVDSRTTLELLRTDRQLGLLATRSLVAESVARRDYARAETLSQQILTNIQASFSDRIVHLAILNVEQSPRLNAFLGETEKAAEENPFYVGELVSWMSRFGFAQSALDWVNGLPPRLNTQALVPVAVADCYAALGQWKGLTAFLEKERWAVLDCVRVGMMSFASWKQSGGKQYSSVIWQQAIQLAARSPAGLNTLAKMAAGWGWQQEMEDVLWFAVRKSPDESWPLTALENLYAGQRNTAGLRRVFRVMVEHNPRDAQAQNNFAMVSLLLGADTPEARRTAAELHAADPENPVFASTHAFSLYLQGRPLEAVQTLRALGLNRLDDPSLAAYYGIFLVATGDKQTARIYLEKSAKAYLLPEEQALVAQAKQAL